MKTHRLMTAAAVLVTLAQGAAGYGQGPKAIVKPTGGEAHSAAFSPDGRTLAIGCDDGSVELWETLTWKRRATLRGHHTTVFVVTFSANGRLLAAGGRDGTVSLWEGPPGNRRATLRQQDSVYALTFSPDGRLLASVGMMGTIRLWDPTTGRQRPGLKGQPDLVRSVAFSPGGKILAASAADGTVRLWELATGQRKATLRRSQKDVTSVAFSPDGKVLVSGSDDGTVWLCDAISLTRRNAIAWRDSHPDSFFRSFRNLAFSPDGATVASCVYYGYGALAEPHTEALVCDLATGKQTAIATTTGRGVTREVAFSPDGTLLATVASDGLVLLWDVQAILKAGRGDSQ